MQATTTKLRKLHSPDIATPTHTISEETKTLFSTRRQRKAHRAQSTMEQIAPLGLSARPIPEVQRPHPDGITGGFNFQAAWVAGCLAWQKK